MKIQSLIACLLVCTLLFACSGAKEERGSTTREKVVIPEGSSDEPADRTEPGEGTSDTADSTQQMD